MRKIENMRNILIFGLYFVLSLKEAFGEREHEIKKGTYPYMAIVYYPDVTIMGPGGVRFRRSAVVIKPDWLISSSLETNDTKLAFPFKTLIARAGAIVLDSIFTFNEDEGEQEREIIQIVRPTNFIADQWWTNDITLLKTLLPFTMTSTVSSTTPSEIHKNTKNCYILVFAIKFRNSTDDRLLMQLTVETLPPSVENCGIHFRNETMICASNSDENKNIVYDPDFCHSNSGGPLICDGDVIGSQTYIDNNCKQPYLYQLLSAWDDFFNCGVKDKCQVQKCANICASIAKDDAVTLSTRSEIVMMPTSETTKVIIIDQSTKESHHTEHVILADSITPKLMVVNENVSLTPTITSTAEITTEKDTTIVSLSVSEEKTTSITEDAETSWPKEKNIEYRKKLDETDSSENIDRTTNVEAQHHEAKKGRSAAESHVIGRMGLIQSLYLGFYSLYVLFK